MLQPAVPAGVLRVLLELTLCAVLAAATLSPEQVQEFIKIYNADKRPVCATALSASHRFKRIVGGRSAEREEYTFMVSLRKNGSGIVEPFPFCGGVMITDRHVLTAAHCLNNKTVLMLSANVADYDFSRTDDAANAIRGVTSFIQHEEYDVPTYRNDIALVTLSEPVPLETGLVTSAILPPVNSDVTQGTIGRVIGWGRILYGGEKPNILREVDLPVVNRTACQKPMQHKIYDLMICAGGIEGKDACIGDSGGPMLIQVDNSYIMAGIVSFGKKCGLKDVSGVYTRAGLYTAWVFQHTLDASCKPAFTDSPNYPDSEYQDLSKPTLPPVISNNNV